jgi:DNA polymerase III sliding clamp (beta) subunit (PCNA family)
MLVRWDERVFKVMGGLLEESDHCLILNIIDAPQPAAVPELVPISEPENGIVFNVLELQAALERLSGVVGCLGQEPVYGNVRLSDKNGVVQLLGVDIDKSLTVMLPAAKWLGPSGAVCFEYKQLKNIVKGFRTKQASIAFTNERATISSGTFKCNMQSYSAEKFTELAVVQVIRYKPEHGGFTIGLPGLKEQIEQVAFAIPSSDGMFDLPSVLLESTPEALRMVATDGFSMAISSLPANLGDFSYTLPKRLLKEIAKMQGDVASIAVTGDAFYVTTELELLTYSKTHSEFPPYSRVIPTPGTFPTSIFVDSRALAESLKRLLPNANDEEPGVMFTVAENGKSLELKTSHAVAQSTGSTFVREGRDAIPAEVLGSANHFKINLKKLLPFLEQVEGKIEMVCKDALHVVDMHAHGGSQSQPVYRFLQMPMSMEDAEYTPAELAEKARRERESEEKLAANTKQRDAMAATA